MRRAREGRQGVRGGHGGHGLADLRLDRLASPPDLLRGEEDAHQGVPLRQDPRGIRAHRRPVHRSLHPARWVSNSRL